MTPTTTDPAVLIEGDCLSVLRSLPDASVDAVITDPPYSSGGMTRGDRMQTPSAKYVQTGTERFAGADFAGDNRDQRSFAYWCHFWLSECLRITKPGGYILAFSDWRQLPTLTDAIQAGGWVWRGLLSWDKGPAARAAFPHYFRHQCEYVAWGTRGACPPTENWPLPGEGCYPGSYSVPVLQADKFHTTGKPTELMRKLLRCVPPGGTILDPFAGSGTTLVAAIQEGRLAIGIEQEATWAAVARGRINEALGVGGLYAPPPSAADLFAGVET